jgi:hypothetical protein
MYSASSNVHIFTNTLSLPLTCIYIADNKPSSSKKFKDENYFPCISLNIRHQNRIHITVAGLNKISISYAGLEMVLQK